MTLLNIWKKSRPVIEEYFIFSWFGWSFGILISFFEGYLWPIDIWGHFRVLYFLCGVVYFIFLFHISRKKMAYLSVVLLVLNGSHFSITTDVVQAQKDGLRFWMQNINSGNNQLELLCRNILSNDIDVVVLAEVTEYFLENARCLKDQFKKLDAFVRDDNYGFALWAKDIPLSAELVMIEDLPVAIHVRNLNRNESYIFVHLPPPIGNELYAFNVKGSSEILKTLETGDVVFAGGDYNFAYASKPYNQFAKRYYSYSFPISGTWPAQLFFPLKLSLDHVFSKRPLSVTKMMASGSDHHALLVEI